MTTLQHAQYQKQAVAKLLGLALLIFAACSHALSIDGDPNRVIKLLPAMEKLRTINGDNPTDIESLLQQLDQLQTESFSPQDWRYVGDAGIQWLRFTLRNDTDIHQTLWLDIDNNRLNRVDLYKVDPATRRLLDAQSSGEHYRNPAFDYQKRQNILAIDLVPKETAYYVLRLENASMTMIFPRLYPQHAHIIFTAGQNLLIGLFCGIILALLLYNSKIYLSIKDKSFFYFLGLLATVLLYTGAVQGTLKYTLGDSPAIIDRSALLISLLFVPAHCLFVRQFLHIDKLQNPWANWVLLGLSGLAVSLMVISGFLSHDTTKLLAITLVASSGISVSTIALAHLLSGNLDARYLFWGSTAFFLNLALVKFQTASGTPMFSIENIHNGTMVFQLILYSMAIVSRIDRINKGLKHEIVTRQQREKQLNQAQRIARYGDWQWLKNSDQIILSESARAILPTSLLDTRLTISNFLQLIGKDSSKKLNQNVLFALQHNSCFEHEFSCDINNQIRHFVIRGEFVPAQKQLDIEEGFIGTLHDVTETRENEQALRKLGYYDSLTGLANRSLFNQRLQHAITRAKRAPQNHAVLFIDLDQFKNINDSLGHDIGDSLLQNIADRLLEHTREEDTVARLGGDEFAILLEDIPKPGAAATVAQHILDSLAEQQVTIDNYNLLVTPSIGIAVYPDTAKTANELVRNADTAMYHAKKMGRNNFQFYTHQLNKSVIRKMELESELRMALERNEFSLHYQPKLDIKSGSIVGAEALLRWTSEKFGNVSPAEFIPVAEETGLIWAIGEYVLETACHQAKIWQQQYTSFDSIAVNISGVQFARNTLLTTVNHILQKTGLPAQHLELEITENVIIDNAEEALNTMNKFKAAGIRLSLDDFGTGYSSLKYLKRFPVDSLKIDRSFVSEIVTDQTDRRIASNIVKLAHSLNLTVVAEGVETSEQFAIIQQTGCDQLQGYIFSKPVTASVFAQLLQDNQLPEKRRTTQQQLSMSS